MRMNNILFIKLYYLFIILLYLGLEEKSFKLSLSNED